MTKAQDYAARYNDLMYTKGNALKVFEYYDDLDRNSEYFGDLYSPRHEDYEDYAKPFLPIVFVDENGEQHLASTDVGIETLFSPDGRRSGHGIGNDLVLHGSPAFGMFIDGHMEGVFTFDDGSRMRIYYAYETSVRVAEAIEGAEQDG